MEKQLMEVDVKPDDMGNVNSDNKNKRKKKRDKKNRKKKTGLNLYHKVFKQVKTKIISAFVLNVIVSVGVLILLTYNSIQLQTSYNEMLDNIFVAQSASNNANLILQSYTKVINFNDSSYLEEAEVTLELYKDEMARILVIGDPENIAVQRRQLVYDDFVANAQGFLDAKKAGDLQAQDTTFNNAQTLKETVKTQMDAFITEEINKSVETKAEIQKSFTGALVVVAIVFIVGFLLVLATILYVSNYISGGLKRLSKNATEIGNGNLNVELKEVNSQDELHTLTEAFRVMEENLRTIVSDQKNMSGEISGATSELLVNVDEANKASVEIADSVAGMIDKMVDQKAKMEDIGEQIGNITEKTSEIQNISQKAKEEAVKSLEAVSVGEDNIDEFVVKMTEIKDTTNSTRTSVDQLIKVANDMNGILESMNGISDQTTLLSLNASIEAARAGAEGRSFGVVAQEIRKLAENSGELGEDIGTMIADTQRILKEVNQYMSEVQVKIDESEGINKEVAKSFTHIKGMNEEVDVNNQQIDNSIDDLSKLINLIELASGDTFELVQDNQSYSESISAAVEEEVATFEEIKEYVESLDSLAETGTEQLSRFKL